MTNEAVRKTDRSKRNTSLVLKNDSGDGDLFNQYLSLSPRERKALFAGTAHTARKVALCRRTIEYWIDSGKIRAVRVGEKYQVFLPSLEEYLKSRSATG